ncbi:MAG: efflux RND transporter permease subunit [Thermotogae bacterium]|nr:efflux RND transporter permease subunit [Thermotogota bacterium]
MTSFFVRRPVFSLVVLLLMLIGGAFGLSNLGIDLFPNFSLPSVSVIVQYPGASPEDVERNVVEVLEKEFSVLENVDEIKSTSQQGVGAITITFKYGTDMDQAAVEVRDRINFARPRLPKDILEPLVFKFDVGQFPIIVAGVVSTDEGFDTRYWAEEVMEDELQRVDGVGSVLLFGGGRKRQINVLVDRKRLEGYGLTFEDMVRLLEAQSMDVPVGDLKLGDRQMVLRVPSTIRSVEDLKRAVVGYVGGRPVRLEEVAEVEDGYAERRTYVLSGNREAVFFSVQKQADANAVKVADAVKRKFKELERYYPVQFTIYSDGSTFIRNSVANLTRTLLLASFIVIIVAFLFLIDIRSALIIALTIPTSLTLSFLYLYLTGSSINMISLSAMAIAVGSVVDAAIVVVENIFFHRLKGEPPREGAIFATKEVAGAITAATITNFVVLFPLLFVPGFVGVMFKELAIITIIVYATSLFLALTVVPSLAANHLRLRPKGEPRWFIPLERAYHRLVGILVRHRWKWAAVFALLLVIVGSAWRFVKTDFFPKLDEGRIVLNIQLERGTSLEKTYAVLKELYDRIRELPDVEMAVLRVGQSETGFSALFGTTEAPYTGEITVRLKPRGQRRSIESVAGDIERLAAEVPGVEEYSVSTTGHGSQLLFGGGKGVSVEIYGDDFKVLDSLAQVVAHVMRTVEGVRSVSISRGKPAPEMVARLDREVMYMYGITPFQVANFLRYAVHGRTVFTLKTGGKNLDVVARMDPKYVDGAEDVLALSLGRVPLGNVLSLEERLASVRIDRRNRIRYVEVSAEPSGRPLGEIRKELSRKLEEVEFPTGYHYEFGGTFRRMAQSFRQMGVLLVLAILIIFLTVAAQFESFRQSLIIFLTSVPFGLAGASLGFLLLGRPFTMTAFVGLVALVGLVVNNAIVLVDYANLLRRRGMDKYGAIVEASRRRLRPVLMSALTTALGVLPLAILRLEGSEFWEGLGVSLSGGLLFSLVTTLLVVPVAYAILSPDRYGDS